MTFEDQRGKTLVTVRDVYPSKDALDAAIASGAAMFAMPESLGQLDELVVSLE